MSEQQQDQPSEREQAGRGRETIGLDRDDPDHDFVDQSKIDFDPDEGLYSGTAVDGSSEIPGPHPDGEDAPATDGEPMPDPGSH